MNTQKQPTIGIAIITHNAKHHLVNCLTPLLKSPYKPRILVVNSSSHDGTVELAKDLGAEVLVIPRVDFNHGTTREKARLYLQTDIIGMMTPDAYFADEYAFGILIDPLIKGHAAAAYARQIPHTGADFLETFGRTFNYPKESHIRSLSDLHRYGVYTFFCSNSCAAYLNSALNDIGGFSSVLLGEDTVAVAKLLRKGYRVAYVAEALVHHSHRYNLKQEFLRSFDTGLARYEYADLLKSSSGDINRGLVYFKELLGQILATSPLKLPYACLNTFSRWLGYAIGKRSSNAPLWLKKALSSQDFYWNSNAYKEKGL